MKKSGSALVSVIALYSIFFIFCGFAIDFSWVLASRLQLQNAVENTVLLSINENDLSLSEANAYKIFSYSKVNSIRNAVVSSVTVKQSQKAIFVKAKAPIQPYFLSALGINNIEIQAQAAAQLKPQLIEPDDEFNIENHLQFTTPKLIFDKKGYEIKIVRSDVSSEYLVYVGLNDQIGETKWVDVTCSSSDLFAKEQKFDINAECVKNNNGDITAAKFIRIINNNSLTPLEVEEISLINTAKLIKRSEFNLL